MQSSDPAASKAQVRALASLIADAMKTGYLIPSVPADALITSRDEAYQVQALVAAGLGKPVGWKIGRKTPETNPPTFAPLYESRVYASGATIPVNEFAYWLMESELMFRIGHDLPPIAGTYGPSDILAAITSVLVVFEIVDSRFATYPDVDPMAVLADGQSHGAMVLGTEIPLPASAQFLEAPVQMIINGETIVDQIGGNPAGDNIDLMTRFVNDRSAAGVGIPAGSLITTGSYTGMQLLPPGGSAIARFAGIGEVEVHRGR